MGYIKSDSVPKKHNEYLFIYICLVISAGLRFFSFFQSVLPAQFMSYYTLSLGLPVCRAFVYHKTSTRLMRDGLFIFGCFSRCIWCL